ncbi:MAG: AAA family ATPase [Alphaproteobacteria bacterium]|nr:AAA family ATPase [Alphaproteobacteria bacterium]
MARVVHTIHPRGFLSFGPDTEPLALRDLNVLIGPNGCGKSNLVEALDVLRAAPGDLPVPIRAGGAVRDWLWRGRSGQRADTSTLELVFSPGVIAKGRSGGPAVRYRLAFGEEGNRFTVLDERIENAEPAAGQEKPSFYFGYEGGVPMLSRAEQSRRLRREDIDSTQSILSQRRDPEFYPELARLSDVLSAVFIYRSWSFGPNAPVRRASALDQRSDRLLEDFSNLPVRVAKLKGEPQLKARLVELVRQVAEGFTDIEVIPDGGLLQLYLTEGANNFPARRLSDGTLRMLCLGAILLQPPQDAILVIEEPELGLHPDLIPVLRDLLLEASERAQIVVTTHSTVLADTFTEHADCVLVCEKPADQTFMTRLDQDEVDRFREDGTLSDVWMSGRLGGTRW